jgi:hypothetical protein
MELFEGIRKARVNSTDLMIRCWLAEELVLLPVSTLSFLVFVVLMLALTAEQEARSIIAESRIGNTLRHKSVATDSHDGGESDWDC